MRPTLADYLVLAINPALVVGLVGSLVFFLLEVLYAGVYQERLQWLLFWYVLGMVLVARIGLMTEIAQRSGLYGLLLGGLTWVGLQQFVEYPEDTPAAQFSGLINLGLLIVVWWSARRLTHDCTHLDEDADATGEGLLQAAGLESGDTGATPPPPSPRALDWWERYEQYRAERQRRRVVGTWVIWFSLAALPLFGLGQSLIPVEAVGRRRYAFWLMSLYLACGLGLLLTTSFLGLRRYLRQRKVQMPAALAGAWLGAGVAVIALLLLAGAFLPRPRSEYPLITLRSAGSPEREASSRAVPGNEGGKGPGSAGKDTRASGTPEHKGGQQPDRGKDASPKDRDRASGGKAGEKDRGPAAQKDEPDSGSQGQERAGREAGGSALSRLHEQVLPLFQWLVFGLLALAAAAAVLVAVLRYLANFTHWAAGLLGLWQRWWEVRGKPASVSAEVVEAPGEDLPPLSALPDPFLAGLADTLSPAELVRYSFTALQAWAAERGLVREAGETPLEFAARVGEELPALEEPAASLAALYARAAYARGELPPGHREIVRQFWRRLAPG